jgi:hypothetical protein
MKLAKSSSRLWIGPPALLFLLAGLVSLRAQESAPYLGASLDLNSRYIWRGMAWSQGPVLQPSIWTSLLGFNILAWANADLGHDSGGRSGFNEIDIFVEGISGRHGLAVVPGLNLYTYPGREEDSPWTVEAVITFYLPIGPVWLSLENDVDFRAYPGAYYAELGLETGSEVSEKIGWEAALALSFASADFNEAYLGLQKNIFTACSVHCGLALHIIDSLSVRPHIELFFLLDDALTEGRPGFVRANLGLTLTIGQD